MVYSLRQPNVRIAHGQRQHGKGATAALAQCMCTTVPNTLNMYCCCCWCCCQAPEAPAAGADGRRPSAAPAWAKQLVLLLPDRELRLRGE